MGVENRDYYRQRNSYDGAWGDWGLYHLTPVVKWIIIVNVVVFVLQLFFVRRAPGTTADMLRPIDPQLAEKLADNPDDEAVLEQIRHKYPGFEEQVREATRHPDWYGGEQISIIQEAFQLETKKVLHGQIWRLITHAFCHD